MMPNLNLDLEYIDHLAFDSGPVKLMNTWAKLSERAGRNDMPAILAEARSTGSLMPSEVAKGLADAWTMAEWLARIFDKDIWRVIFGMALSDDDFLTDDGVVLPHTELPEVLTLWRGALPDYSEGMSWTSDKEEAIWFAHRLDHDEFVGHVYEITVGREVVLAKFDDRGESEYVIDLDLLFEDDVQEVA